MPLNLAAKHPALLAFLEQLCFSLMLSAATEEPLTKSAAQG
eukprot:CAMPEP_0175963946 /NCGR_PEP_ID=MMETSP0108-20121206/37296_1 /TAXON_ID=195067 ORGANISM="Goniomonas pacifica, Strain CCMP1869" /NCGR_SAMPLE_ID=MMETSP0108 /ASSEMBLY_ACC=CAM_ASM_000204 /LENGTH=40 /DNA_ID= /DNA_START= /DNA_END= /DNA_ORIENTATION=